MPTFPEPTTGDTSWFVHDCFGLFIHPGICSAAELPVLKPDVIVPAIELFLKK